MKLNILGKLLFLLVFLTYQTGSAQTVANLVVSSHSRSNTSTVKAWYTAFEKKDWSTMQQILGNGFTFSSPLDDHIDVKTFKERCWPNAYKIKRIDVDKFIINGDSAFVITNGWTTEGKLFRNGDYFRLKD